MLRISDSRNLLKALALSLTIPGLGCGGDTSFTNLDRTVSMPYNGSSLEAAPSYLRTFSAGSVETADILVDTGYNLIEHKFALKQQAKTEELYTQLDRTLHEDVFTQGHKGIATEQSFSIAEAGIFDLLIVIDNSSSMGPYQKRLGETLPSLLKHISNTNWQIAVITTSSACLNKTSTGRKVLTRADFDKDAVQAEIDFKQLINVGEFGNTNEKGILMSTDAMTGMGCQLESNSWLRPDSQRAIILVSDEQNCGSASNEGCPGAAYEKANYFFDRIGTNVTVNALLLLAEPPAAAANNPSDPLHDCANSGGYLDPPNPAEYVAMVQGSNGIYSDICTSNYNSMLEQISLNVRKKINIQYELAFPAEADFTAITIDGKPVKKFSVSGKTINILDTVPSSSSVIVIKYKHTPVAMKKAFGPKNLADTKTFEVLINNNRLEPSQYKYNSNSGELELMNLPPEQAEIKLRYRHNNSLLQSFAYSMEIVDGSMEVLVDGEAVQGFQLDKELKRVVMKEAPADGRSVRIRYERPGDRTTQYAVLGAFPEQIENFKLLDGETGEVLSATLENGSLQLPEAAVSEGRKVKAVYNLNYDFKDKVFATKINEIPFPNSVKIDANGQAELCEHGVTVKSDMISFSCADEDFEQVHVQYQYARDYKNSFDLNLEYSGPRTLTVYVNNQILEDYHMIDDLVVIQKKYLPPGSEVKVLVKPL